MTKINMKITHLKSHWNLSGAYELINDFTDMLQGYITYTGTT